MDELKLLDIPLIVQPCRRAQATIGFHGNTRTMSLTAFSGPKGYCVWCNEKLAGRKQRWCSDDCMESAYLICCPQDPATKMYRLIFKQNWACAGCGESFEEELRSKIREKYDNANQVGTYMWDEQTDQTRERTSEDPPKQVRLHSLGYATGDRWQTDHIIPIHKGGKGIDPLNLQVLCVPCHKKKTADERR